MISVIVSQVSCKQGHNYYCVVVFISLFAALNLLLWSSVIEKGIYQDNYIEQVLHALMHSFFLYIPARIFLPPDHVAVTYCYEHVTLLNFRRMYWGISKRPLSTKVWNHSISTYQSWRGFSRMMTTQWGNNKLPAVLCAMLQGLVPFQWWTPWFRRVQVRHCISTVTWLVHVLVPIQDELLA